MRNKCLILGDTPVVSMAFAVAKRLANHMTDTCDDGYLYQIQPTVQQDFHKPMYNIKAVWPSNVDNIIGWL